MKLKRPIPRSVRQLLSKALEKRDEYAWLFDDPVEQEAMRRVREKKFPKKFEAQFEKMRNESVDDWAKRNSMHLLGADVIIMGTDHSHFGSWKAIENIVETCDPDIIAVEDEHNARSTVPTYSKIMRLLNKYDGDVRKMVSKESIQSLQRRYLLEDWMKPLQHFNVERMHLNLIDSMAAFHFCDLYDIDWYGIDLDSRQQEVKTDVEESYRSGRAYEKALEMCYNVPEKYLRLFKIDALYELIQAGEKKIYADATFVQTKMKKLHDPKHFTMLIHLRNIYMAHKIQVLCKSNPGKKILVLQGASHIFGTSEFLDRMIPLDLIHALEHRSKSKKQLLRVMAKYGGSETKPISKSQFAQYPKPWILC